MEKPTPTADTKQYYDYTKCCDFLQEKYDYDERDFDNVFGRKGKPRNPTAAHKDFWHWVFDNYEIHNPCHITFSRETLETGRGATAPDWVKLIYSRYLDEFADTAGEVSMLVGW